MILSDRDILIAHQCGRINISPWDPDRLQPASVDLTLGADVKMFNGLAPGWALDTKRDCSEYMEDEVIPEDAPVYLRPNVFILGVTAESITLPDDLVGRLEGKSSLGRLGLLVHATAGFVDPGWSGPLTLELSNINRYSITLYRGMPIAQITFMELTSPAMRPYGHPDLGSHYVGATGPEASKAHLLQR